MASEAPGNSARVVAVLDAVVRAGPNDVGVRELAAELDMSRSAVHRILVSLGHAGYAHALPNGRYRMTGLLTAWGARLEQRHAILATAHPVMADLAGVTGENVHLYLRLPGSSEGVYVATSPGSRPVSYQVELGRPSGLHVAAAGRACLAGLPDDEVSAVLHGIDPEARARLTDIVAKIREDGYAVTVGQLLPEASGVAAAVQRSGSTIGSLTVSMPAYRLEEGLATGHQRAVIDATTRLSAAFNA